MCSVEEAAVLATVPSATLLGARGLPVLVEVHVGQGLPAFSVVGLPDEVCREARDRVRAALVSSGVAWPQKRLTVNLAPSGLRKGGAGLDLPIAVGLLVATEVVPATAIAGLAFVGELGLDGSLRRVNGMVPLGAVLGTAIAVVPADCMREVEVVTGGPVRGVASLAELVGVLRGERPWPDEPPPRSAPAPTVFPDLAEVRGHRLARQALTTSAAGGHHLLLIGPPGSGKTMLAQRLPGLLPPLEPDVALETTMVHSAAGLALPPGGLVTAPPLRAPHHTASTVAMVGGGTAVMRPGEVSCAHGGVLFLDELAEFAPSVLDGLREPLEEGVVRVTRARATVDFPARFLLVAAMNPCPCGASGKPGACRCAKNGRTRYLRRVSGPLLDRFDLRLEVDRPSVDELLGGPPGESSAEVAARVSQARARAAERGVALNARIPSHQLDELAPLTPAAHALLRRELETNRLTGRGLHRVRRVARTIADLEDKGGLVDEDSVVMALSLRIDPTERAREDAA
jgi:magnesium chelatase family protein